MHENTQTLCEKCGANIPAATRSYSMVKIACLNEAFSPIFQWVCLQVDKDLLKKKQIISELSPCALKKTCYIHKDGNCVGGCYK